MTRLWSLFLPELRQFPDAERDDALRAARDTPLDVIELVSMALALVVVTAFTRYSLADASVATRFGTAVLNFAVALPLLGLGLGPVHARRLRRGLRHRLRTRGTS